MKKQDIFKTLVLALMMLGVPSSYAWADTWDGNVPSLANVSKAVCNGIGITGSGTQTDPYVISTAGQFAYFASKMNNNTNWWKLAENTEIDLASIEWTYGKNNWTFKGHFDGNGSTIKNMKITTTATGKGWGLFSNLQGSSATDHAFIKNLTIADFQISTPTGSYAAANIGLLVGKSNGNTDIENITVTGGTITVDVEATGAHNVAGIVGQLASNENNVKNCSVSNVSITSGTALKKEYYVGGITGNAGNYAVITGNTVSNLTVTIGGNTSGNNVIGGLIGKITGVNSTAATGFPMGKRSIVQKNTVSSPSITMNGSVDVKTFELGGLIGWIGNHTNAFNNKVESPTISLNDNINAETYVGGAIGYQDAYSFVDGMTVNGTGSITGPSTDKTVKNAVTFFVGGYLGYMGGSGVNAFQANKFKNIAVTGMNINLGHYKPAAQIQNHKFSVGGIAGSVNAPNMKADYTWAGMPENLIFKGGTIYAPWASTSPTVSNFNAAAATHQNMTPDVVTTIDNIEKAKVNTWYYNDYKLGLSSEFLNSESVLAQTAGSENGKFRKNYDEKNLSDADASGIRYLPINNNTFGKSNRYQDSERDSKTVLWWTLQASMDKSKGTVAAATCFTADEQPIYPQSGATAAQAGNLTDYPHYMYFFQGVSNATYVADAVATTIVNGIEANLTNNVMPTVAISKETNLTVNITNDGETRRGFDSRNLTVSVKQGESDVTANYTYKWYVNGVENGTGVEGVISVSGGTISLVPHWKDSKGVTVNVIKDGTIVVATASYGFAPGVMHTQKSKADATAELVRSDFNGRGTKDNPYIIDCESALRQLSYLSTVHTSTYWETLGKPGTGYTANQIQGHYDRAYYELVADIDLKNSEFTPISHVGYGSDGSFGTYSTNWIFQGVFDGKGHKISNFKVTWGASQYVGSGANLYYGLFGCVGGAAATRKWGDAANANTTIKNLVIDNAELTHNTSETSFYYSNGTSGNASNCFVGVLAGIVSSNTTIENIEIRNSTITDKGSSSEGYSLAAKGLFVGGAIGGMQHAFGTTNTATTSLVVKHIAANVNIALTLARFVCDASTAPVAGEVNQFNVGGIIGRYMATSATQAQAQASMPKYTLYSGTVNAPKAWISPVLGALRYTGQNGGDFKHLSKQWEGNSSSAATQITITNALYYNFYIGATKISDTNPSNTCGLGFRTMAAHTDGSDNAGTYSAAKYQGVNYGARCIPEQGISLELLNKELSDDGYNFAWDEKPGTFVHITTDKYVEFTLSRDGITNSFTASLSGAATTSYTWQVSFDGTTWHPVTGKTDNNYTVPVSLKTKYVKASTTADNGKTYTTLFETVEGDKELCAPEITSAVSDGKTLFTFNLNQKDPSPAPAPELKTTYQWYKTNKEDDVLSGETNQTLEIDNTTLESYNKIVWCKAVVSEYEEVLETYFLIYGATVVYVDGTNGIDNGTTDSEGNVIKGRGYEDTMPVKTINHANSLLKTEDDGGTIDNNIIVIMGLLNNDYIFQSKGKNPATLTGFYKKDYNGVIRLMQVDQINPSTKKTDEHLVNKVNQEGEDGANCYVLGDTKFENLTFYGNQQGNTFIELHGRDVVFGKGLVMQNFRKLSKSHGNFGEQESIPELTILLTATNLPEADIKAYTKRIHERGKPQVVTFQSGHYGRLMGGRFTESFFKDANNTAHSILASADYPIWAEINVEIDNGNAQTDLNGTTYTRDVNAIIAGLTDGSMYGDYTINFYGGNVAYIVGANQGNPVNNGDKYYTPVGGKNGKWGQWPNASYFGRTVINIEDKSEDDKSIKPITVGNLYAGGLGRMSQSGTPSAAVDMYVYGRTEVNVKSGTVSGSVYGGGVGGVLGVNPWDAHVPYATTHNDTEGNPTTDVQQAIINNVQYGDNRFGNTDAGVKAPWSSMTPDSPMAKVKLHNLNADGITYSTENLDLRYTSTTLNVYAGNVNGNIYGGGYGYVQDMNEYSAMQGIGSVFGTTNINISGGSISGNVYGGSQGDKRYYNVKNKYEQTITNIAEMNGTVNINISGSPEISGDIYGAGKGIASNGVEDYFRIATTGNEDLADDVAEQTDTTATDEDKAKYKSTVNITIDLDENATVHNIFGGGELGAVDGQINVIINSGQINGNVYGGGKGEKASLRKARVNGTTNVTVGY